LDERVIGLDSFDLETGEPVMCFTTFLMGRSQKLEEGQVILKNYSENEGLADALALEGLGRVVGGEAAFPIFQIEHPKLLALMKDARLRGAAQQN
jgi:hypothetical protein